MAKFIDVKITVTEKETEKEIEKKALLNSDNIVIMYGDGDKTVVDTIKGTVIIKMSYDKLRNLVRHE